jgi:Tol biopolymer transport system component
MYGSDSPRRTTDLRVHAPEGPDTHPAKFFANKLLALGVVLSALAAVCVLFVTNPADAAFPGKNGRIVFESDRDGNSEIYSMNPDGSDQTNLTDDPASDNAPAFSPDGERIAFASDRNDPDTTDFDFVFDIFVMDADGSNVEQLTDGESNNFGPAFSPDGRRLAFTSDRDGDFDIYILDIRSGETERITRSGSFDFSPDFSPDGKSIAFESDRENEGSERDQEIYTINLETRALTNVSRNTGRADFSPSYSPNGKKIAFQSCRPAGAGSCDFDEPEETRADYDIFTANADGTDQTGLTTDSPDEIADNYTPAWSPNGKRIAYAVVKDRQFSEAEIFTMNASDGSDPRRLTQNPNASDFGPDWGPRPTANPSPNPPNTNECTIRGTARDDVLRGTPGRDVICGFGGNDVIYGLGGDDRLVGGPGDDVLRGGPGDDVLLGGRGDDVLRGEGGRDRLDGGPGRNSVKQ